MHTLIRRCDRLVAHLAPRAGEHSFLLGITPLMFYNPVNLVDPVSVVNDLPQTGHPPMIPDTISHYTQTAHPPLTDTILEKLNARVAEPVLNLFQCSNSAYAGLGRGAHGLHNRMTGTP